MRSACFTESWQARPAGLREEDFFAALPAEPFAFLYGPGRWLLLAEDPIWETACPEELHFERRGVLPPILPDLIGLLSYEFGYGLDPALPLPPAARGSLPDHRLAVYRRVRLFDREAEILYEAVRDGERNAAPQRHRLGGGAFAARKTGDTDTAREYAEKAALIREQIARGEVYQVNLTRQEEWQVRGGLGEFARRLFAANPAPYSALVAGADWSVISSSPECFFQLEANRLVTRPIKGTAPRGETAAADARLAAALCADEKNRAELAMIVDLLRNDLGRLLPGSPVHLGDFPTLETYANVHHLVAGISVAVDAPLSWEQSLKALFPGGSITGCPKIAAMHTIRELEPAPRRIYTGILGWMRADLGQAAYSICIRTAWVEDRTLRFGTGGGVVWDSDPRAEYEETVHKARSLVRCLNS